MMIANILAQNVIKNDHLEQQNRNFALNFTQVHAIKGHHHHFKYDFVIFDYNLAKSPLIKCVRDLLFK